MLVEIEPVEIRLAANVVVTLSGKGQRRCIHRANVHVTVDLKLVHQDVQDCMLRSMASKRSMFGA